MLTIKQINEDKEAVIRGLEKKHFAGAREAIEAVLNIDRKRQSARALPPTTHEIERLNFLAWRLNRDFDTCCQ